MHELKHYIEKFSSLNTAKMKGHRAPHKAVLLLAIIDLVEERKITSPCIDLSDELIERFNDIWHKFPWHVSHIHTRHLQAVFSYAT